MLPLTFATNSLSSWGAFTGRQRKSDSPYIESVWEGVAQRSGKHFTAADATIDLVCLKKEGVTRLLLSGPTSKAYLESFEAGEEALTIKLRTSAYLPYMAGPRLTDADLPLPSAGSKHFWLQGSRIALPDFDNAETFIAHLVAKGILTRNLPLEHALQGRPLRSNLRTMQRHTLATTGLTMSRIRQIKRAEEARTQLTSDYPLTQVAYNAGYSNPGHMTKAFTYFFGQTPSALRALMRQDS